MQRNPRRFDSDHLAFIRTLPCLCCLDNTSTEAAHVRYSDARVAKVNPGSQKPDDRFTVPLCGDEHKEQHQQNERRFWEARNIDPVLIALALYSCSGDAEEAERIIRAQHPAIGNIMRAG